MAAGWPAEGLNFRPAVLTGVTSAMTAYRDEISGPIAVVVPFARDIEGLARANDTELRFVSGDHLARQARPMTTAGKLEVVSFHVANQTVNADSPMHLGCGRFGRGSSIGGSANPEAFTHWQWMTRKSAVREYPFYFYHGGAGGRGRTGTPLGTGF